MASPSFVSPTPRFSVAARSNGIIPIPAHATQKQTTSTLPKSSTKVSTPKLKIIVRQLPPALSLIEFESILGDDWRVHKGKVDWLQYKPGKIPRDPTKPSKPSRAYLHLTKEEYINQLSHKVRTSTFNDAKGSSKDPALLGPPSVEFAPYSRIPNGKVRNDLRQGTIDQDQEFIDFLESLTNPISKPLPVDHNSDAANKNKEKVTTTPLIQFLKDKKANKGKDIPAPPKGLKQSRQDSKESKNSSTNDKKTSSKANVSIPSSPEKKSAQAIKVEKAAREVVRVINKQTTANPKNIPPSQGNVSAGAKVDAVSPAPAVEEKRKRGNASAAAKILQRDLGLGTHSAGRGGKRGAFGPSPKIPAKTTDASTLKKDAQPVQSSKEPMNAPNFSVNQSSQPAIAQNSGTASLKRSPVHSQPPKGPVSLRTSPKAMSTPDPKGGFTKSSTSGSRTPSVTPTATKAFLKHANPSQGITETLLEETFDQFGPVTKVEIDTKKGFAYVDFAEPRGLQAAIEASPIKIAQGQVIVLERKAGPTLQARNSRGGSSAVGARGSGSPIGPRGGRGGSIRRGGYGRGTANATNPAGHRASLTKHGAANKATLPRPTSSTIDPGSETSQPDTPAEPVSSTPLIPASAVDEPTAPP